VVVKPLLQACRQLPRNQRDHHPGETARVVPVLDVNTNCVGENSMELDPIQTDALNGTWKHRCGTRGDKPLADC